MGKEQEIRNLIHSRDMLFRDKNLKIFNLVTPQLNLIFDKLAKQPNTYIDQGTFSWVSAGFGSDHTNVTLIGHVKFQYGDTVFDGEWVRKINPTNIRNFEHSVSMVLPLEMLVSSDLDKLQAYLDYLEIEKKASMRTLSTEDLQQLYGFDFNQLSIKQLEHFNLYRWRGDNSEHN